MVARNYIKLIALLLLIPAFTFGCMDNELPIMTDEEIKSFEANETNDLIPYWHRPIKKWRTVHMDKLKSGKLTLSNCIVCHNEPEQFCNACHKYMGVKNISIDKSHKEHLRLEVAPGITAPKDGDINHLPIEKWRFQHDNAIIFTKTTIDDCLGCHQQANAFCNKCHTNVDVRKIK